MATLPTITSSCELCLQVGRAIADGKIPTPATLSDLTRDVFDNNSKGRREKHANDFLEILKAKTRHIRDEDIALLTGATAFLLVHSSDFAHKDYDEWFVRRSWLLRPSRFRDRGDEVVRSIVDGLGKWERTNAILGKTLISSLNLLCDIYPEAIRCHRAMGAIFDKSEPEEILASTLFVADEKYRSSSNPAESNSWPDALSLVLGCYKKSSKSLSTIPSPKSDERHLGQAVSLLSNAIGVNAFQDIEELVLMIGYSLSRIDGNHRYALGHTDHDTLLSHLSWPHQRDERRFGVAQEIINRSPNPSLHDAVIHYVDSGEIHIVPQRCNPGLAFSLTPAACSLAETSNLYIEEIEALWNVAVNLGYNPQSLLDITITGTIGVTAQDILLTQRLFSIIGMSLERSILNSRPDSSYRSRESRAMTFVLPLGKDVLWMLMDECYGWDEPKTRNIVNLLTTDLSSSDRVDILARPLLKVQHGYRVPLAIATGSNLIRNVFQITKTRVPTADKSTPDWLADETVRHFKHAGWICVASDATPEHETDVVALKDGVLFILECKSTISPTCPVEEQRSWSAMRKAAKQLSLRKEEFSNPGTMREILRLLKVDEHESVPQEIVTAIITGSGHMEGHHLDGHCVISVDGLGGFLQNPKQMGPSGRPVYHWKKDIPDAQSVKRYLTGGYWNMALRSSATVTSYQRHIGNIAIDYPALSINRELMQRFLEEDNPG